MDLDSVFSTYGCFSTSSIFSCEFNDENKSTGFNVAIFLVGLHFFFVCLITMQMSLIGEKEDEHKFEVQ